MVVQIQKDGNEYHVQTIQDDGSPEHDGTYVTQTKAERRAEVLAKLLGCDWETNY